MRLALVGPGIMPIPPDGWGAVESLIWDYALELDELGHEGTIVNTPNYDEIINFLKEEQYDFAHIHYDVFHPIMDRIAAETDIPHNMNLQSTLDLYCFYSSCCKTFLSMNVFDPRNLCK